MGSITPVVRELRPRQGGALKRKERQMLVLTRKIDQGIVISENIYVRVLGVERDRVKIGISAPLDITVLRQELLDRDKDERGSVAAEHGRNSASGPVTARNEPLMDGS
jgi:carbon storage regulator CsrA